MFFKVACDTSRASGELIDRMLHQRGRCGVFGNVRAAFHREADVGGGERGGVVDTIADHRHGFAGGFEFLHFGSFIARTHITEACAMPSCLATYSTVPWLSPLMM